MKPPAIVAAIVACIVVLGATAYWDEQRESAAALADFAHEQAVLARQLAAVLRASTRGSEGASLSPAAVAEAFVSIDEPGVVVALVRPPGAHGLLRGGGTHVESPRLAVALDATSCRLDATSPALVGASECSLTLTHEESAALGLPSRMGMAGLASFEVGPGEKWEVAVVAGAARERDRERRASARTVLSFLVSSALVLALGTLALRKQRRELVLAAELAVADAVRARDERLVRADKLATMGALATGIAHEVSTPLGVIVGRAEQLASKVGDDARAARSVSAILEQAARIKEIIRAFLTLARGGSPTLEQTDPRSLAVAAVDLVAHRFHQVDVTLSLLPPAPTETSDPLPNVACDRRLLEQALVNLLLNACDACSPGGHVEVRVGLHHVTRDVTFSVTDDGSGITSETAARATEPFFTTKPEGLGTGLGLAITREIVHHHRGTLSLESRQGSPGTIASISLPPASASARASDPALLPSAPKSA